MKVSEAMTRDVRIASPDETICDAAKAMAAIDAGALPVGENERLAGMITDRDIAVRAVAERKSPDTRIRDVMTWSRAAAQRARRSPAFRGPAARIRRQRGHKENQPPLLAGLNLACRRR